MWIGKFSGNIESEFMTVWNVIISKSEDPLATSFVDVLLKNWLKRGVKGLINVLQKNWLSKSNGVLNSLEELSI